MQVISVMYRKYIKRFFDILALILLSPVLVITSVVVYMKIGAPIFFRQRRPGKNEKIFEILKFRTMTDRKDDNGKALPDEIRLTKFGAFLRSTSIDELPELINIVKGDMAIVGPRPLLVKYLPLYNERQSQRHDVRPGLTGLAQVNGRNAISWEQKFDYDVQYVQSVSFLEDWKIICKTIQIVLKKEGISSDTSATMTEFKGTIDSKKSDLL